MAGRSRVIFVGNIPYDFAEEQLIDVFREVGTVVGFRLVFDRQTGKPKGYGFCEYEDVETAASAVRNLNDKDLGGRPLRIDYADVDPMFEGRTTSMGQVEGDTVGPRKGAPPNRRGPNAPPPPSELGLPPNLPTGQPLQSGISSTDAISQTLAALPPNQLLDILAQMKSLVTMAPEQAKILLNGHPQLAYALFQAMLMMNVVDPNILQQILQQSGPQQSAMPPPGGYPGQFQQQQQQQQPHPQQQQHLPSHIPPHMQQQQQQQQQGYSNMSPHMGAPPQAGMAPNLPDDQRALLDEVLKLTPEQIDALPPDQRQGILQLKASLGQA